VNTLREWLGHESLDVTLAYLKGSDAASELCYHFHLQYGSHL